MLKKTLIPLLTCLLCLPAGAEQQEFSNTKNAPIPDDAKKNSFSVIDTMSLPKQAQIKNVTFKFRINGDESCASDYKVSLVYLPQGDTKSKKYTTLFDGKKLKGKCTDEGLDDDKDNDTDLVFEINDDETFNRLTPQGKWYLAVRDQNPGKQGQIAYFKVAVDYVPMQLASSK